MGFFALFQGKLKKANSSRQRVGVAWYKPGEWEKLRQAVSDPERLELAHREWLQGGKKACREFRANGVDYERVIVAVDELVAWCRERGVPFDAGARSEFAASKLQTRYKNRR